MFKNTGPLWRNIAALFISYLAIAMPLPVISVFVKNDLGLSNSLSGFAVGIGFLTTIFCVKYAGNLTDTKGGKAAMQFGILLYALASFICLIATLLTFNAVLAYSVLLSGRFILGVGETIVFVGMLSWNISLMGLQRSGLIFSLVGASVYAAFAFGGPLGSLISERFGFTVLMLFCFPLPLISVLIIKGVPSASPEISADKPKISFFTILKSIWRQGTIVCLQGVGFAVIGAFTTLYFSSQGWLHSGFALTFFGIGFVLVRLLLSHFPDKYNGYYIATVSLFVVGCGQLSLWLAPNAEIALLGTFLTGVGASLVYPSMGVEVVKNVSPEIRGIAMGTFSIFQDTAYGLAAPVTGLLADHFGYSVVFLAGFIAALLSMSIAIMAGMQKNSSKSG